MLTHMQRASQGPFDTPEDTWVFVGTNIHLQLFAQTLEGLCTGRTSPTDFGSCGTWNKTLAIAVEISPKALTGLILSRTRYAMDRTCGK